jgi:SPP1 gp7 family putative phage head morphogenesis protein
MISLNDEIIKNRVYLQRFAKGTYHKINALIDDALERINAYLARETVGPITRGFYTAMEAELNAVIESLNTQLNTMIGGYAGELGGVELDAAKHTLQKALKINSVMGVSVDALQATLAISPIGDGTLFSELTNGYSYALKNKLMRTIRAGYFSGESYSQVAKSLREIKRLTKSQAQTMVLTAWNNIANVAADITYKANADLVKGEEWCATLDPSTCPICGDLDGETWALEAAHAKPPLHSRCRCAILPVLVGENGQGRTLYRTWLKRQSYATQSDILGTGRADALRAGATLDDITDHGQGLVSVAALKEKYGF